MNKVELEANPQLTDFIVQNLNTNQVLPYKDEEFDLCTIAVSVQYLTSPVRVFEEIARVLKPNGKCCVSFSNRMFHDGTLLTALFMKLLIITAVLIKALIKRCFSLNHFFGLKVSIGPSYLWHVFVGTFSGILGGLSSIWSPPIAMYLIARNCSKQ